VGAEDYYNQGDFGEYLQARCEKVDVKGAYITIISQFSGGAYKVSILKFNSAYVNFLVNLTQGLIERKCFCQFWQV
jgi:hypothetical protein